MLTSADGALAEAIVFWKPLWRQTVGSRHPGEYEVDYLAQAHWRGFHFRFGEMIGLDRAAKKVHLAATLVTRGWNYAAAVHRL